MKYLITLLLSILGINAQAVTLQFNWNCGYTNCALAATNNLITGYTLFEVPCLSITQTNQVPLTNALPIAVFQATESAGTVEVPNGQYAWFMVSVNNTISGILLFSVNSNMIITQPMPTTPYSNIASGTTLLTLHPGVHEMWQRVQGHRHYAVEAWLNQRSGVRPRDPPVRQ